MSFRSLKRKQGLRTAALVERSPSLRSCQHIPHNVSMDVGQPEMPTLEFVGEFCMVNSQAVHHRGVEVVDIHRVFHNVVTEVIGFTIGDATFDASTGHPQGKAARMMIATVVVLSQ